MLVLRLGSMAMVCGWSTLVGMRSALFGFAVAAALALSATPAGAQTSGTTTAMPAMGDMHPVPPPEQLPAPVRMTGIGNSHITIKATTEAQAWFDQGLSLMHDFWDYESVKAFEQAIRNDPNCAMCYWGLARALGFRRDDPGKFYGEQALKQASRLKNKATKSDRLYIEAAEMEARQKEDEPKSVNIYRKLVKSQPHDLEARIFLALTLSDGYDEHDEPKAGEKESIAILESVLKDAPDDSAANHYWIHAMEPSKHPERAVASAARLASLAPTSGHMVHMPGHIYYRVGDYASADKWFSASTAADEHYMREQHVSVDNDWNYVHNLMYAIANLMEQGRLEEANALSDRLAGARGQLSSTLYIWSARDQMSRVSCRLPVALRVGDWDAVLTMLDDARLGETDKTSNLRFLQEELRYFAQGMLALEHRDLAAAQAASTSFDAVLWRQDQDSKAADAEKKKTDAEKEESKKSDGPSQPPAMPVSPDAMLRPLINTLSISSLELRAGILLLEGKSDPAKALYAQAITAEKKLGYREPPFYIRPVAETEAQALLREKDYAEAKSAYQAALDERPASGFELYGIARADELAGKTSDARTEYRAFLKAWPSADPKLAEVLHAREVLGASAVARK
jgi:tetratricopeptide (TPR) repeat protein